jgi:hypothetical protein
MGMNAGNTLIDNTLIVGSNTQMSESVALDSFIITSPKTNISISSPTNKILMQPGSLRLDFSSTAKIYNYAKTFDSVLAYPITLSSNSFKIIELILGVTFVTGGVDKVACYKKTLVAYGDTVSLMQDDFTMLDPYLRGFYLEVSIAGSVLTATLTGTFPSYDSVTAKMKVVEI